MKRGFCPLFLGILRALIQEVSLGGGAFIFLFALLGRDSEKGISERLDLFDSEYNF